MATYSPFTRYRSLDFTAGQNQVDRSITTISKNSFVSVRYTGGSPFIRENSSNNSNADQGEFYATYFTVNGVSNILSKTDYHEPSNAGIWGTGGFVPAGAEIRTSFQTSSGTANFTLDIFEID